MRVLAVIPARAGSKGVPGKNLRLLGGRPLLAWTADAALAARRLTRIVVSTESEAIAEIARRLGLEVPFRRPSSLAGDVTPMRRVVSHAIRWAERHDGRYDAICLLQPSVPFRAPGLVDACIDRFAVGDVDAVMSVRAVPARFNPHWVYETDGRGRLQLATGEAVPLPRRQLLPAAFYRDGAVYVLRPAVARPRAPFPGEQLAGFLNEEGPDVNIDGPEDWAQAVAVAAALARAGAPPAGRRDAAAPVAAPAEAPIAAGDPPGPPRTATITPALVFPLDGRSSGAGGPA